MNFRCFLVSDDWMLKLARLILFLLLIRVRVLFALFFGLPKRISQVFSEQQAMPNLKNLAS